MDLNVVYQEDCVGPKGMCQLPDNSVDMILCDLPYSVTANSWDISIPEDKLWKEYLRVVKSFGAMVFTAIEPFTSRLLLSNLKLYRHKWVWNKNNSAGFATVKIRPFQVCEDILVFGKNKVNYFPIMEERGLPRTKRGYSTSTNYGIVPSKSKSKSNIFYPKNLLTFSNAVQKGKINPTQKPVALFEYLIKTYTNEGAVVLDNCIGSGTTAIACLNTNRYYVGYENDPEMYIKMNDRILNHKNKG